MGDYNTSFVNAKLLHYNGNTWSNVSLPPISGGSFLYAIDALNSTDVWIAGGKFAAPTRLAYAMHYNGTSWSEVNVPAVGSYWNAFNSLSAVSANDVWAGGYWGNNYGDFHSLIMHWNGSTWVNSALPANIVANGGEVLDIKAASANDAWAVGYYLTGGMFKVHWDGTAWTEVIPANGGGGAFAIVAPNNAYSFGGEISKWNGSSWTVVDSLKQVDYPALGSAVVFPNGDIWAAGRKMDTSGTNFYSLVYRSVNNTPVFNNGANQMANFVSGSTNTLDALLKVQDADVAQQVTYSIVTAPVHGTLNGLPAVATTSNGFAQPSGVTYTPVAGYSGTDQFVIKTSVGSVSSLTTITANIAGTLPVVLGSFNVIKQEAGILVDWMTVSESNTLHFNLERSLDGINYSKIYSAAAKGNSSVPVKYSWTDVLPHDGSNYYRLKLIDKNGQVTLFPVKTMIWHNTKASAFVIHGNVVSTNGIQIRMNTAEMGTLMLVNMKGEVLRSQQVASGNYYMEFSIPSSAAGTYILSFRNIKLIESEYVIIVH